MPDPVNELDEDSLQCCELPFSWIALGSSVHYVFGRPLKRHSGGRASRTPQKVSGMTG